MNLKLVLFTVALLPALLTDARAEMHKDHDGPKVALVFDEAIFDKDLTKDTAGAHVSNLMVALLEGKEDVLAKMDEKKLKLDKKRLEVAKAHAKDLKPLFRAALIAALEERGAQNQNLLKQVLEILKKAGGKVKETKSIDRSIVGVEFDDDNVLGHLDNITIALLKGDEGVLAIMDAKSNDLEDSEIVVVREGATNLTPGEKAALIGALKARGDKNKHALKQILDVLTDQI